MWSPQTSTDRLTVLTGATVMARSIQVLVQMALLFCVVTTSMGGVTDWQKAYSQLENKVKVQEEEIKSLHQILEQVEMRLRSLETKGEFVEVQIQPAVPTLHAINIILVRIILLCVVCIYIIV